MLMSALFCVVVQRSISRADAHYAHVVVPRCFAALIRHVGIAHELRKQKEAADEFYKCSLFLLNSLFKLSFNLFASQTFCFSKLAPLLAYDGNSFLVLKPILSSARCFPLFM